MKHNTSGGFTIVELLVAILATAVMVLIVAVMLISAWRSWVMNNESVRMQRDVSIAMRVMAREIRRTPIANITDGNALICSNTNGVFSFTVSGGDLTMQKDAETPWVLVQDHVTSFSSSKTNATGAAMVALGLDTGTDKSTSSMVIYSRND